MTNILSLPLFKRKFFCVGIALAVGALIAFTLPAEALVGKPMAQTAIIINALVMGFVLTIIGVFDWQPVFRIRMHPLWRGAAVAAFVHLDYAITMWPDQPTFWKVIIIAAVFGAVIDLLATQLFGEGQQLLKGMTR